jgi:hypothetical protein
MGSTSLRINQTSLLYLLYIVLQNKAFYHRLQTRSWKSLAQQLGRPSVLGPLPESHASLIQEQTPKGGNPCTHAAGRGDGAIYFVLPASFLRGVPVLN